MSDVPDQTIAAYITARGSADHIQIGALPTPAVGPTDVIVRARSCAVNHVDTYVRSGAYPTPTPFPFVIGRDVVGTVAAVGSGVAGFAVGDDVWCNSLGHGGRQGSFATHVVVPVDRLYPLPAGVDPDGAVVAAHPGATAYLGLVREAGLVPGETVVVAGAGGGVGSAAVQLAAMSGARVLATASGDDAAKGRILVRVDG
jgi:NADPH:quinone reductase-like Zn-dependent oxidoreductase